MRDSSSWFSIVVIEVLDPIIASAKEDVYVGFGIRRLRVWVMRTLTSILLISDVKLKVVSL